MLNDVQKNISIIVPVGPNDDAWKQLIKDLAPLCPSAEIVLVGTQTAPADLATGIRWIVSKPGRALQLNAGACESGRQFLWFLHADSRVPAHAATALPRALAQRPEALHYFNLRFLSDGPPLMRFNALGVWVRSHLLRLPFGDQGLCIQRTVFQAVGGFNAGALSGEDHLLVWAAHLAGIPVVCTGATLLTSARKYRQNGWAQTTARTIFQTWQQACPGIGGLLRKIVGRV